MRDRTSTSKIFRRRRHTLTVVNASVTAMVGMVFLLAYWLHSAKLSCVNPLAYLRYPILNVKTFKISSEFSSRLADLSFSDPSGMLFAAAIEALDPAAEPLTKQPSIVHSGVQSLAFRDSKMKSSLMATDDTHSTFVTVGDSLENNAPAAHVWSYLPLSDLEGPLYQAILMKTFALESITDVHMDMSESGSKFVIAAQTKTTSKLWIADARSRGVHASSGEFSHTLALPSPAIAITFSPDEQTFVTAHVDDTAYLWDANTGAQIRQLSYTTPSPPRSNLEGQVVFSADGSLIAMVNASAIYLWQSDTGALVNTFTLTNKAGTNSWGHTRSLAISSDNQWIASDAGHRRKIYFWDAQSGELLRVLRSRFTDTIAFSPDDTKFASGSQSTNVTLWELPEQLR